MLQSPQKYLFSIEYHFSFTVIFCPKNCTNEINSPKFAYGKYLWNALKNRSNEICTNEILIRREPPIINMLRILLLGLLPYRPTILECRSEYFKMLDWKSKTPHLRETNPKLHLWHSIGLFLQAWDQKSNIFKVPV